MKYYLIIEDYASNYLDLFDSEDVDVLYWVNGMLGWRKSRNRERLPNWGYSNKIPYLICKDPNPTRAMEAAANDSAAAWNLANPHCKTGKMQLIFKEEEKNLIRKQQSDREAEIMRAFTT